MTKVYKDETKRNNLKAGIKAYWDKEESHIKASIRRKGYYDDKPEELARMKEANRRTQKAIWTEERRRLHSEKLIKVWQDRGIEMRDKTIQTMKENNTLNSSKPADECKQLLIDAGFTVQAEAPYPNKTWRCDVYVEELELYIEFHFGFYHNSEPFNPENPAHLKEAEYLKKTYGNDRRSRYAHRLYTWTDLDVRKRQYALEHEMNWFAFYSKGEFERWLKTLIS